MTRFRLANLNDVAHLNQLVNSAYRGDFSKKGWTTEADLLGGQRVDPEGLAEMISTPGAQIELALENDVIIGCVYLKHEKDMSYFGMLTVHPEFQAQGLGRKLLERAEALTKAAGNHYLRMTVISQRQELIAYYERRGFRPTGKTEPFPEHDPRFGLPKAKLVFLEYSKKLD